MSKRVRIREGEYRMKFSFPEDAFESENMYIDHSSGDRSLTSFPGYRKLLSLDGRINGIIPDRRGAEEIYLVHAGEMLYKCRFADKYRDSFECEELIEMADSKSSHFTFESDIYILDGGDITIVKPDYEALKVSEHEELAYCPITYKNGEEYEQQNLLSPYFREQYSVESIDDISYGTAGLAYKITSESKRTCALCPTDTTLYGRVDIPTTKKIGSRYYRVTEIASYALYNQTRITEIIVGAGVEKISPLAFAGCSGLTSIMLGENTREIGSQAMLNCSSISKYYLSNKCVKIEANAFQNAKRTPIVYFSGSSTEYSLIEGNGEIASIAAAVQYNKHFQNYFAGIPVFTPAESINTLSVNGEAAPEGWSYDPPTARVKIPYASISELEGAEIEFSGLADLTLTRASEYGTYYSTLFPEISEGYFPPLYTKNFCEFDDRFFLFGSSTRPNVIFRSSMTAEGRTHPLYFGGLDYTVLGSGASSVDSLTPLGERLAAIKKDEGRGRLYVIGKEGRTELPHGGKYPVHYFYDDLDIRSGGFGFSEGVIFMSAGGIKYLQPKSDTRKARAVTCGEKIKLSGADAPLFSKLGDYIAIFADGKLYLGDAIDKSPSEGELKWYPITEVTGHTGDSPVYYYSYTAPPGLFIHPNEGAVAEGAVMSEMSDEGEMIYYVRVGIRNYAVNPGSELFGGEITLPTALSDMPEGLIFGTAGGELFALNTDKRSVPPRELYEREDFSEEEYKADFGGVIHPLHYTHAGHRVRYGVKTEFSDGELPYLEKSDLNTGLVLKLGRLSPGAVAAEAITDRDTARPLISFPLGELDFGELDFGEIALTAQESETHMITEKLRNWVEKQIIIYTNDLCAPFSLLSLSYGFKIKSKIKNR